jgi:hypothetical protein
MISKACKNHLSNFLKRPIGQRPQSQPRRVQSTEPSDRALDTATVRIDDAMTSAFDSRPRATAHGDEPLTATPQGRSSTRMPIMRKTLYAAVLVLGGCKGDVLQGVDFSKLNCPAPNSSEVSATQSTGEELSKTASLPAGTF